MFKNRKGFSLAEVLITLLIIGIVGAATIPTVTKRSSDPDKMWNWGDYPVGSASFVGTHVLLDSRDNQVQIPAHADRPHAFNSFYFDNSIVNEAQNIAQDAFLPSYDKLILINNYRQPNATTTDDRNLFQIPHISFYNKNLNAIEYAGRLVADPFNLAFGVGSLQLLTPDHVDLGKRHGLYNTAIGHYALFSNEIGSYNTALGRMALASFRASDNDPETHNVAIGNESQMYNLSGKLNTAVGYRSLSGVYTGSNNIALGANALGSGIQNAEPKYPFENNNIGIGANAGYNLGKGALAAPEMPECSGLACIIYTFLYAILVVLYALINFLIGGPFDGNNDLFIAQGLGDAVSPIPLIKGEMENNKSIHINANELIVNTADGKHTILKINMRLKKDPATGEYTDRYEDVFLPELADKDAVNKEQNKQQYTKLNYCAGEGTEDVYRLSQNAEDPRALADICIANFANNLYVVPAYSEEHGEKFDIRVTWDLFLEGKNYNVIKYFGDTTGDGIIDALNSDWDIFISGYDYAYDLGQSKGINFDPSTDAVPRIQTVKAALNYLDTFKQGEGLLGTTLDAIVKNLRCSFTYFIGGTLCGELAVGPQDTLLGDIKAQIKSIIEETKDWFRNLFKSDIRLKDVYGKSTIGLKEINALKIKNYTYKADKKQTPHVGVIAQELQKVFPNSVVEDSSGYLRIKQEEMFYAMINAIKELDMQDKELKTEVPKVNKKIKVVVDENKKLLTQNEKLKAENEKLFAQLKELNAQ